MTVALPWSLVGLSTDTPWKSAGSYGKGHGFPLYMALPRQVPRLWPWHVPRFCPWQPPWYQPWQLIEVPRQLPRQIPWPSPRQLPRHSTAINGECHGIPRQLPRQSSHGKCHGNTRQLPRNSTAVATTISTDVKPQQFPRNSAAFCGHPRQLPR